MAIGTVVAVTSSATATAGLSSAVSLTPLTAVIAVCDDVATPPPPIMAMLHSSSGFISPMNDAVSRTPASAAIGVAISFIIDLTAGI